MVEKYGMESARQKIVENLLNSPVAMRALYVNNPTNVRKVNSAVKVARAELQKSLKDDETKRILNHYYARYLENVYTSDSTLTRVYQELHDTLKNTPLKNEPMPLTILLKEQRTH